MRAQIFGGASDAGVPLSDTVKHAVISELEEAIRFMPDHSGEADAEIDEALQDMMCLKSIYAC